MAEIRLEGIGKRFGDGTVAVGGVDLRIADGEFFVLLGPSGCGKSTLLNIIVGLEQPTEGTIRVDGESINGVDPSRRNMAMVFQSYAIYPHMSVRENLGFPLEIRGFDAEERSRKIEHAARILELTELLDRRPATLSGGQRQRVAMGRALVREPVAFLLDEPLSNLDAQLRGQMRGEIARLHRRMGTTTVYVTHDQSEALTLADRMAVLNQGVVQQVGTPAEVYRRPANRFVAGFIGAPPMSFMTGSVSDGALELPLGKVPWPLEDEPARVEVGLRPEDVHEAGPDADQSDDDRIVFHGSVELVEWMGSETHAYVRVGAAEEGVELVVRLPAATMPREGDDLKLSIALEDLHFFDPETGHRLNPSQGGA